LRRFGDSQEPALREQVSKALLNRGIGYENSDNKKMAIIDYEDIVARFDDATEPEIEELVRDAREKLERLRGGGAPEL
jgi:hypothetical protein